MLNCETLQVVNFVKRPLNIINQRGRKPNSKNAYYYKLLTLSFVG